MAAGETMASLRSLLSYFSLDVTGIPFILKTRYR